MSVREETSVDLDTSKTELTRIEEGTVASTTAVDDNANTNPTTTDAGDTDDTDITSRSATLQLRQATSTTTTRSTVVNPNTNTARSTTPQPFHQDTARAIKAHDTDRVAKTACHTGNVVYQSALI